MKSRVSCFSTIGAEVPLKTWLRLSKADFWLVDCLESARRCKIERAFVDQDSLRGALLHRHRHGRCTERSATEIKANAPIVGCRRTDRPLRVRSYRRKIVCLCSWQ